LEIKATLLRFMGSLQSLWRMNSDHERRRDHAGSDFGFGLRIYFGTSDFGFRIYFRIRPSDFGFARMKTIWALALGCSLTLAGCGKKPQPIARPVPSKPEAQARQQASAHRTVPKAAAPEPTPVPSAPTQPAPAQPIAGVVAPFLTSQLKIFIQEKGRLPESFAEFAAARLDNVPPLQAGLSFVIDPATREVKIVKK
jgi:hypothetical protein